MQRNWFLLTLLFAVAEMACAEPFYQEQLVFPLQDKHVHSSCIVECPNGDLLVTWFHGSGERRESDVLIQGARLKKGRSEWSPVFLMADTPEFPDCNPVLFIDSNKDLWLFWIAVLAERWEDSVLRYRKASHYQGKGAPKWSWQEDIILKPGDEFVESLARGYEKIAADNPGFNTDFGGLVTCPMESLLEAARNMSNRQKGWMTRTHVLVLPSGRILLPLYSDGFYVSLMAISDDQGKTWRASSPVVGACLNQPSVVRKQDGTLVAYMRSEGDYKKRVMRSESTDDGETWSPAIATDMPNPNASIEAVALQDGRWIMAYNDCEDERETLALAMSDDEGASWKWMRHLEQIPGGAFHYPSIIQTRDGRIHVTYTYRPGASAGKSIKHVTLNAEWIIKGD
ncbi:MAG TPA: exo-alpha-sialidase [bacterium]|nr:exo-alpha-sialidase [bacterium]